MARYGRIGTQYFDSAGNPLIAGKLFFTESGSTTPKNTFADVNLTIPNTNPVILTGAGRQPNIFFNGTARVILTDSDDVQIELRDPDGAQVSSDTFAPWNALSSYDFNDIVQGSDDRYYTSITNGNIGNDPVSTSDFWMEIRFINVWEATYPFQTGYYATASDDNLYISQIDDNIGNDPTSSPTEWLKVSNTILNGTANGQVLRWVVANGRYEPTSDLLIDDDGNVGINVTAFGDEKVAIKGDVEADTLLLRSPTSINNVSQAGIRFADSANVAIAGIFGNRGANNAAGSLSFHVNAAMDRFMTALSSGFVGINTSIPGSVLDVNGQLRGQNATSNIASYIAAADGRLLLQTNATSIAGGVSCESFTNNTATRFHFGFTNTNGSVGSITTNGTATAYNIASDYRLKDILGEPIDPLARLLATPTYHACFKADPSKAYTMFLAHELQVTYPHAVTGDKDAMLPAEDAIPAIPAIPAVDEVTGEDGEILIQGEAEVPEVPEVPARPERINPQQVDHSFIIPDIVAAVQELSHKNNRRKAKIVDVVRELVEFKQLSISRIKKVEARLKALEDA